MKIGIAAGFVAGVFAVSAVGQTFVNWENPHVHPLDLTPDQATLLAVNTADNQLEVFDISNGLPIHLQSIPIGLDPVSVRARTNNEIWVVNHISDSISVVDLAAGNVVATIRTLDEPADLVFAGNPVRAFVACSQANTVQVFDPTNLAAVPTNVAIDAEDPRAMAVSPDGNTVYVAIFESGNGSTILGGGGAGGTLGFPPNVVNEPAGPHGGVNPPPNDGVMFDPPQNPANPAPPAVGMIVKKDASGVWMDDNGGDWTELVSGTMANLSGRPQGWDLPDRDVAMIDTATLGVTYANRLMNICMAIGVNPASGDIAVVGTDATNEIRFEPIVGGKFLRVNVALVDAAAPNPSPVVDLNPHLTYATSTIPQGQRDLSLGDPRGIVWNAAGNKAYVSGMGSNNVIAIDAAGARTGPAAPIEVGEGPTGMVWHEGSSRLYVMNKFEGAISVIDTTSDAEIARVPFFDPTSAAIKTGRKHLYDTHKTSGLGHIACASCHVDARMDRLAWDLGAPDEDSKEFNQNCNFGASALLGAPPCEDWHPMKGPMATQTLQDIIGKEPFHWRGDRDGLEEFNGAFVSLQGDDQVLTAQEMQEYENFLATVTFPPNPFRNLNNTLPTSLPLPGHYTGGRFAPAGQPLPNGNASTGLTRYRTGFLDMAGVHCVTCHSLPVGVGANRVITAPNNSQPIAPGPNGELHHGVVSVDGSTNVSIKVPQLRNLYEKVGFDTTQTSNRAGFGFLHDGSVDSIARFVSEPVFTVTSDQDVANLVAFMLSFSGSDLPTGSATNILELPGPSSKDSHAAVGRQTTVVTGTPLPADQLVLIGNFVGFVNAGKTGLVVKGLQNGEPRGYAALPGSTFQSDRAAEVLTFSQILELAGPGEELTYTVVPRFSATRIGIDRDEDGYYDGDERDACSDPADAASNPFNVEIDGDFDDDGQVTAADYSEFNTCLGGPGAAVIQACRCAFDFDMDADLDLADYAGVQVRFDGP